MSRCRRCAPVPVSKPSQSTIPIKRGYRGVQNSSATSLSVAPVFYKLQYYDLSSNDSISALISYCTVSVSGLWAP